MNNIYQEFYSSITLLSFCCTSITAQQTEAINCETTTKKPNIVFILADDMGINDLGCYGQRLIKTPNIDKLAAHGLQFINHYSGSTVSAPSRCCLLTGKDTGHAYIRGNEHVIINGDRFEYPLAASETTIATILQKDGYATECVGKWGLGGPGTEGNPLKHGFDYFYGYLSQSAAHNYYPKRLFENDKSVTLDGKTYSHYLIMDKGLEFIKQHAKQPFFAYFAITLPHAALDIPSLGKYANKFEEVPFVNPDYKKDPYQYRSQPKPRAAYAAMVSEVDRSVDQIIQLLKKLGISKNTIIIFSSDNGVHTEGGNNPEFFNSNGLYRGYKRDLYDGGIHVPFIISWPKYIHQARKTKNISTFWDFLPTVCDILSLPIPAETNGISYLPTILNKPETQKQHDYLYYEFYERGGKKCVLKDGWKLVELPIVPTQCTRFELYNLNTDISELHNVAKQNPNIVKQLQEIMKKAHTDTKIFTYKE